jgi:predicted secreted protein
MFSNTSLDSLCLSSSPKALLDRVVPVATCSCSMYADNYDGLNGIYFNDTINDCVCHDVVQVQLASTRESRDVPTVSLALVLFYFYFF